MELLLRNTPFRKGWALSLPHIMATLAFCGRADPRNTDRPNKMGPRTASCIRSFGCCSASNLNPSLLAAVVLIFFAPHSVLVLSMFTSSLRVAAAVQAQQRRLGTPEPMLCILQGILAFRSKMILGPRLILWEILHFARVWVCLDALASLGILGPGAHFVEGCACCKPWVLILWKVPDIASP